MINGYHTLRVDFDPHKFEGIHLPNSLIIAVDSDHARDNHTHQSFHNSIAIINNIGIDWKTKQQKCIALRSTNIETRGASAATSRCGGIPWLRRKAHLSAANLQR